MAVLLAGLVALVATTIPPAGADPSGPPAGEAVRLVVDRGPVGDRDLHRVAAAHGGRVTGTIEALDRVMVEAAPPVDRLRRALTDLGVDAVDADVEVRVAALEPADPLWDEQWGLPAAQVPAVWDRTTGDPATVVAVLDTGVDGPEAELGDRLLPGVDLVTDDGDPDDENGHGTAVAAVAAAASDGTGMVGACPRCSILPVRVLDDVGQGSSFAVAEGVVAAVDRGADVVNISATLGVQTTTIDAAVDYATAADVVVVASAGNEGTTTPQWPAADPDVVGVGGHERDGSRHPLSSHGAWVEVAAAFCTPAPHAGGYASMCGTSFSAPVVSGLAGLLVAARPDSPARVLRARIIDGASGTDGFAHGAVAGATSLAGLDAAVADATTCPAAVAASRPFADVAASSVHAGPVACSSWWDLLAGDADGRFRPGSSLTRGQVASVLARVVTGTGRTLPAGADRFDDDDGSVHEPAIDALTELGIVTGLDPTTYGPDASVTRAQLATLVVRTLELLTGSELAGIADRFDDDDGSVHEAAIDAAAAAGIVNGVGERSFAPSATVRRDQAATVVIGATRALVEAGLVVAPDRR